jgi:excisionase family DNA binding protein
MDSGGLKEQVAQLCARVSGLEQELDEARRKLARLGRSRRRSERVQARLFLTLNAAAEALGLSREMVRRLVREGALRALRFPDGKPRVPRSELQRIDTFGFDRELPVEAQEEPPAAAKIPAPEAPLPRTAAV